MIMNTIYVVYRIDKETGTPYTVSAFVSFDKAEEAVKFLRYIDPDNEYVFDASPLYTERG